MASEQQHRLQFQNPVLYVCDIQEKFRSAIWEFDKVTLTARKMLRAATALQIPICVTTQNRARLGATVAELQAQLADSRTAPLVRCDADKTRFSMWVPDVAAATLANHLQPSHPQQTQPAADIAIVGIEAHICVTQTALDALRAGCRVHVLADGVSSSRREEVALALARLRAAGAVVTTSEAWLYECMGDAAVPAFREIVALVKETAADTQATLGALCAAGPRM